MRKLISAALVFLLMFTLGCDRGGSVDFNPENPIDINNVDDYISEWTKTITEEKGSFIARGVDRKGHDIYYLYIKNIKLNLIEIGNDGDKGLKITVTEEDNQRIQNNVQKLVTRQKNAEYIILNDNKLLVSELPLIIEQ